MYTSKSFGISHVRILAIIAISLAFLLSSAPTLAQSGEKPRAPELYIPITTHDTVLLKWWEPDDPAKLGITYEVQRRAHSEDDWNVVGGRYGQLETYNDRSVGIPFTDSSVSPNTSYTYRVYAIKGDRRSDSSARMRAVTEPAPEGNAQPVSTPEATPNPTPQSTTVATPNPTPQPTTVATLNPTPQPTTVATLNPTPQPTTVTELRLNDQNGNSLINGVDDLITQTIIKPTKISELDGGENDPVIDNLALTRSTTTSTSIKLEWTVPVGGTPTGYRIWMNSGERIIDGQFYAATVKVSDTGGTTLSETITSLSPNTPHYFWVAALYGTGTKTAGLISKRMPVMTDPSDNAPSAVRNLRVNDLPNDKVRILWDAAEASTGCPVSGHDVTKWSLGLDRGSNSIGNVTQYDWDEANLRPDDVYVFSVTPKCGTVTGERATVRFETGPVSTRPPAPQPHLAKATATQVELKWYTEDNPRDNNWGFEVERKTIASAWSVVTGTYAGGSATNPGGFEYASGGFGTIWYDNSVSADTFYAYRIATVDRDNANAKSVTSNLVTAQTLIATSTGAPGAPVNITTGLVLTNPKAVRIMWDPPDDTGSSAIIGYQILKNNAVLIANTQDTNTTYDDTDVSEGQYSIYRVRAINTQGAGLRSRIANGSWSRFSLNPPPGTTVHTRPDRAGTVTVVITNDATAGNSSVTVTWTDGTAGTRVCHTDYYLVYGFKQNDGTYQYVFGPIYGSGNPGIHVVGAINLLNQSDPVGPYARSYTKTLSPVWTTTDPAPLGQKTLNWKLKVYCGSPFATDSAQIGGEATPTISS